MLGQHLRRWPNIKPASVQCLVSAVKVLPWSVSTTNGWPYFVIPANTTRCISSVVQPMLTSIGFKIYLPGVCIFQASTRHWPDASSLFGRRQTNVKPALGQCLVLTLKFEWIGYFLFCNVSVVIVGRRKSDLRYSFSKHLMFFNSTQQ